MLRCLQRPETDPYYNLAAEEYLLKTATADTFMIWRNEPSVIIGKHQNTSREINHPFIESINLPVIRRITGGGTVYHDLGNINFSFIYIDRKGNLVDFRFFTKPVILFLQELGLDASFEGKNNITVNRLKVSGNSAHIFRNKVLHHGTLLFNTDLEVLEQAIAGHEECYKDKSVRSVRAEVTNIYHLLENKPSIEEFIGLFQTFIFNYFPGAFRDELNNKENESILRLAEEKYKKHEWNFGYSSEYKFDEEWATQDGKFSISLFIKQGLMLKVEISGPEASSVFLNALANQLTGTLHEKKSVSERLKKLTFANENEEKVLNQIIQHLF
ncbi:MAG: biotin/lipoate A/B protein ligase family protein [Bacteroidales bacterium]